ncbi:MAG: hypothetical protein IJK31_00785 [Ruminococcus sp.]|nr:hypothetical protein [Ruminococcus sp.]
MSSVTELTKREAVPVVFSGYTLWCESFKAEETRVVSEKATVDGKGLVTNSFPKLMKLTFCGRICDETAPLGFVTAASGMLRNGTVFAVSYRGLSFTGCRVQSFKAEDKSEAFIYAEISVLSSSVSEEENA